VKLSVIIVNYNVRFFLEQAIRAAIKASAHLECEIIVVDNHSTDGSKEMVESTFPNIQYIYLENNLGFSKANNIGIKTSQGEYVLLLNPDTVVAEDAFETSIKFMDATPSAGGIGVHMIDGSGTFLPESKRGLPTPSAAFYKIFGLSLLFPNSRKFGKYHLGYLNENEIHEVEILSGAYMMMRKAALEKSGLLDETFFMYGEDIDLSYRLIKAGYKNYYYPKSRIIHYKGESTKKGSVNYVFVFYRAMVIFAKKHFEKSQASLFGLLINSAIYFRASLALISRLFGKVWQILLDGGLVYGVFLIAASWYEEVAHKDFGLPFISIALFAYTVVILIVLLYSGVYDRNFKYLRLLRGWSFGFLTLLGIYALLPEEYRFSRAVLLIGSAASLLGGLAWRMILHQLNSRLFSIENGNTGRTLIVGNEQSLQDIRTFLEDHSIAPSFSAGIFLIEQAHYPVGFLGNVNQLKQAVTDFSIDDVIFDTRVIENSNMISLMNALSKSGVQFKMAVGNPLFLLGSQEAIGAQDTLSSGELRNLNPQSIIRLKRTSDLLVSMLMIPFLPLLLFLVDEKVGLLGNVKNVLIGKYSWVGYDPRGLHRALPKMRASVTFPLMNVILPNNSENQIVKENVRYLNRYSWLMDFSIMMKHIHSLGRSPISN